MIPVLTKEQAYKLDKDTIESGHLSQEELMDNAGRSVAQFFCEKIKNPFNKKVVVVCGKGNNGGDGVITHSYLKKYNVSSKIVFAEQNHGHSKLLQKYKISKSEYSIYNDKIKFDKYDCIIDAIFGIGLSRNINSNIVDIFHNILSNKPYNHDISWNNKIISIDTPSGQFIDSTYSTTISIYPKYILELGFPKVGNYFHFPTPQKHILDIGFKKLKKFDFQIIDEHDIDNLIKPFYKDEKIHKHKKKVNIIAGSDKYPGAAILCSKAALQSGSGYVNLFVDTSNENTINLIKNNLPESIVESLNSIHDFDKEDTFVDIENLLIGPGINFNRSMNIDYDFYNFNDCVIDAGGLKNKELSEFPLKSILTPHMGEFQGLFKFKFYVNDPIDGKRYEYCGLNSGSNFDFKLFKKIQKKLLGRIIILKSFNTYIIDSDMIYIMDSGPSLLATAGTGDVLSGILVSLLSQGYSRLEASVLGTYLHAEAANYYMNNISKDGMTASDLIDCIPYAFNKLRKND